MTQYQHGPVSWRSAADAQAARAALEVPEQVANSVRVPCGLKPLEYEGLQAVARARGWKLSHVLRVGLMLVLEQAGAGAPVVAEPVSAAPVPERSTADR